MKRLENGLEIYTYTHIYIHTYTYKHIYTHIYTYKHTHIHIDISTYIHIHIYTHTYSHTQTHIHTYKYICIQIHIYTYIYIHIHTQCIHIHIHTHIHTYTHTYILLFVVTITCLVHLWCFRYKDYTSYNVHYMGTDTASSTCPMIQSICESEQLLTTSFIIFLKLHKVTRISLFSLFISQINLSLLVNFMKFIQLSVMHWIKLSLSLCKALQVEENVIHLQLHCLSIWDMFLLCRGIPWCLPFSIFRECADKEVL